VHHVLDLRDVTVLSHASAQAPQHLAQRGAGPMDIVVALQHCQDLPLDVISGPLTDALG
jgi:hypothetical protein